MSGDNVKELLSEAWRLAEEVYGRQNADAQRFMENPQPACLGLTNDERRLMAPEALIKSERRAGFDRVAKYLNSRLGLTS